MLKKILTMLVICSLVRTVSAQNNPNQIDSLKIQLTSLKNSVDSIKKSSENPVAASKAATAKKIKDSKDEILNKQLKAIKICADFTTRFAQGSLSIDAILSGMKTGISIAELSSPFVNPEFKKSYDSWISKWGKFIPAVVLPAVSLGLKNNNAKVGSISIGLGLTTILSAISSSDKKRNIAMENAINSVTSTMDLFQFNRAVHDDLQKLKSMIGSVNASDSTFSSDFSSYWKSNKDISITSEKEIVADPRFLTYIENSTFYFERFQLKLARVNYTLDYAQGLINTYISKYEYVSKTPSNHNITLLNTKKSIDSINDVYRKFKGEWDNLQKNFYVITPAESRTLQLFSQLEEIKVNLE